MSIAENIVSTIHCTNQTLMAFEFEMMITSGLISFEECWKIKNCSDDLLRILKEIGHLDLILEKVMVGIFYSLAFFLGILGNLLVILTIVLGPKSRSATEVDVINPCLLNLAAADLLIIIFVIPIRVFLYFLKYSLILYFIICMKILEIPSTMLQ